MAAQREHPRTPNLARFALRLYALLLRLFPLSFRTEFGAEMQAVFAAQLDQAARQGSRAVAGFFARELTQAPRAVWGVYHLRRYQDGSSAGPGAVRPRLRDLLRAALDPQVHLPASDGRAAWPQAVLEVALFAGLGGVLILETYLPLPLRPAPARLVAGWVTEGLPFVLFGLGLYRGLPAWAYPAGGALLGQLLLSAQGPARAVFVALLVGLSIALAGGLALAARRPTLRAALRAELPPAAIDLGRSLARDWRRLSFGFYGLLPPAIRLAFDDGFVDHRTPWLAAAVLFMVAGALAYSRSRTSAGQAVALLGGLSAALSMAVLDHAHYAPGLAGAGWVLRLALPLAGIALAPLLAAIWQDAFRRVEGQE